jgi:hypothetical protein
MRRWGLIAMASVAVLAIAPSAWAAAASGQHASGVGKSHLGATFGFVAQESLHAQLEYNNGTLNIHCQDILRYNSFVSPSGYLDAKFQSENCFDKDGNQYHVWVDAGDGGEGVNAMPDKLAVRVKDLSTGTVIIVDRGKIQNGNVQVIM